MTDPVTTALLIGAGGQLLANGIASGARWAIIGPQQNVPLNTMWAATADTSWHSGVDVRQLQALQNFIDSPEVQHLTSTATISAVLLGHDAEQHLDLMESLHDDFVSLGRDQASTALDANMLSDVWDSYADQLEEAISGRWVESALTEDERNALLGAASPISIPGSPAEKLPRYLRRLLDVARDFRRMARTAELGRDIKAAAKRDMENLRLQHAIEEHRRPLSDLFVEPMLRKQNAEKLVATALFPHDRRARVVVTGAPGAGKTTLTQHQLHAAACSPGIHNVPLLVRAREYEGESLLTHAIARQASSRLQMADIDNQAIEDLLVMGRAVVVFDGIDEILELANRRRLVQRIEAFAIQYPMASILVTSRNEGYENAPLSSDRFVRARLLPFDDEQVREYAVRWFSTADDDARVVETFLQELESVPDLRENPLMLSLLCTLYRARGYIPRNRRQVYQQCADLLFNRWDSMRQIEQPTDHIQHGQDLIQDLAVWFFKSSAAQRGVEEAQLTKVLSGFFEDSAGVLPREAKRRAKLFLDFCADRAWLLGKAGTNAYGERLFVFTHQTFMEYFAAEGLARTGASDSDLSGIIIEAYEKNPSSVLPELVLQAAGAVRRTAPRDLITEIQRRERLTGKKGIGRYLGLRLRLMTVATLAPRLIDALLVEALHALHVEDSTSTILFDVLLELPRDSRDRLVAHLDGSLADSPVETDEQRIGHRLQFLEHWSALELLGASALYAPDWQSIVDWIWDTDGALIEDDCPSLILRMYARHVRQVPLQFTRKESEEPVVGYRGRYNVPGSSLRSLQGLFRPGMTPVERAVLDQMADLLPFPKVSERAAAWYLNFLLNHRQALFEENEGGALYPRKEDLESKGVRATLLYVALVSWELRGDDGLSAVQLVEELASINAVGFAARRESAQATHPPASDKELSDARRYFGEWVARWCRGNLSFVFMDA